MKYRIVKSDISIIKNTAPYFQIEKEIIINENSIWITILNCATLLRAEEGIKKLKNETLEIIKEYEF